MTSDLSRRRFLAQTSSCAAHLALASAAMPALARAAWARAPLGTVVAREPFGTLERIAEGVWAMVSTPLGGDRTTLCNGGIIAGRNGVLAIEGFAQPAGAQWLAARAKELTGRPLTHVVLTHYHSDHANGVAGYLDAGTAPTLRATARTRDLVLERNLPAVPARSDALQHVVTLAAGEASRIDLGGRVVRIAQHDGHTPSDLSLEIDDPQIVFCGDLVWNAMFPNYVDAVPTRLAASARALRRSKGAIYVPGHGPLAREAELDRYLALLDEVERGARAAHAQGRTAAEGAASFVLPESSGTWAMFSPAFFERAFTAWYKEIG